MGFQAALQQDAESLSQRSAARRINQIVEITDKDSKGTMNWDEFIGFFRTAGLLLEYEFDKQLESQDKLLEDILIQQSRHRQGPAECADEGMSEVLAHHIRVKGGAAKEQRFRHRRIGT